MKAHKLFWNRIIFPVRFVDKKIPIKKKSWNHSWIKNSWNHLRRRYRRQPCLRMKPDCKYNNEVHSGHSYPSVRGLLDLQKLMMHCCCLGLRGHPNNLHRDYQGDLAVTCFCFFVAALVDGANENKNNLLLASVLT